MGLDMFLFAVEKGKEKYLVDNKRSGLYVIPYPYFDIFYADRELGSKLLPYNLVIPNCDNPGLYHKQLCYWRKNNAIHNWFVRNVQNGIDNNKWYRVSYKQLLHLKLTCEEVVAHSKIPCSAALSSEQYYSQPIIDPSVAKRLLPTLDGYFNGDTDYNGYYIDDIKETIKDLEKVLEETDFDRFTVFYNSWS